MTRTIFLFVIALTASATLAQQMYRWTDEKGRVHITDTPPPASAKGVQKSKAASNAAVPAEGSQQTPYDLALAMKEYPVSLYTSPMCKEACQKARDHLNKRGVPFREKQVANQQMLDELQKVSGGTNVPVLVVGAQVEKNASPDSFNQALDNAGYPRAGVAKARNQQAPPKPEPTPPAAPPEKK